MDNTQTFQQFLTTHVPDVPVWTFIINLLLTGLCGYLLGQIYIRYGRSLSNRNSLARNFVAIGMTTMLIISIVKSSLALSLGLVGALSIVRFRTAIKEPEELAYLFITISIGLGLGAGQRLVTLLGFAAIAAVLCSRGLMSRSADHGNLYLVVSSRGPHRVRLEQVTDALQVHCSALSLKRFDDNGDGLEASYRVVFDDYRQLEGAKNALKDLGDSVAVSFLDSQEVA